MQNIRRMQKHLPERVQKGQGTMRAFTFENATKIYFGGGCVKEHLLEAVKPVPPPEETTFTVMPVMGRLLVTTPRRG